MSQEYTITLPAEYTPSEFFGEIVNDFLLCPVTDQARRQVANRVRAAFASQVDQVLASSEFQFYYTKLTGFTFDQPAGNVPERWARFYKWFWHSTRGPLFVPPELELRAAAHIHKTVRWYRNDQTLSTLVAKAYKDFIFKTCSGPASISRQQAEALRDVAANLMFARYGEDGIPWDRLDQHYDHVTACLKSTIWRHLASEWIAKREVKLAIRRREVRRDQFGRELREDSFYE